ncbi:MAG TPA: 3,4-dihydroxy-2-butanone-4-phosphate synthase, partial [Terricaulis sp.]|nr:3,4-dihydroxy-2-butanone-4-phosphate synthase [Terricaulis sp.]
SSLVVWPAAGFPLMAREGGVLVRAGHTEASVDIARQAGLIPAAVICEIMNDDGTMARLPELIAFAQFHNLKIGAIDDLIAYRRAYDRYIDTVHDGAFAARAGFRIVVFRNRLDGVEHIALVKGEIKADQPTLVRVHRIEFTADVLGADVGRAGLIERALNEIEAEGAGVLVLLRDLTADAITRAIKGVPAEAGEEEALRVIGVGSQILHELGVGRMILLSNAEHKIVGLEGYGLSVDGWRGFSK